jgi:hypothetical protein
MLRKTVIIGLSISIFVILIGACVWLYNNVSFMTNERFASRAAISTEKAEKWVEANRSSILKKKNAALLMMLRKCDELKSNSAFEDIVKTFLDTPITNYTTCWKREIDPNRAVDSFDLNRAIEKESIDNKWMLYAIAPDKAHITPEEMFLFDTERWQKRQLTHQLIALVKLRETRGPDPNLDKLIERLCNRISGELYFDLAVVDIYIQKVMFTLMAGHPEKIRRRWVERIISNQRADGGWNDRWFCLTSNRRPTFNFKNRSGDQHATIQAVTALYLVKYKYPEYFGLK